MTRIFPTDVDVVIVGSGPTGAAYARILSEQAPGRTIAMFEAGPQLADPPGLHVKNIVDEDARREAQRRSEGLRPHTETAGTRGYADPSKRVVRPGTQLLERDFQLPGEDGLPAGAMSTNVGGMGAHWTCACPRPGEGELIRFLPDLEELLDESERLLGVSRNPFADAPYAEEVRRRLSAEFDEGRAPDRRVAPMPLAVHTRPDGELVWSGPAVVFGEAVRGNPHFTLLAEALVTRVLVEDGRAAGVVVRDRTDDTEHTVRARFVVVAADAFRTPQVLFASDVRPAALGRYLNDQPQIVFAVRLRDVDVRDQDEAPEGAIAREGGVSWVPYTDEHPFHGQVMQLDASPIPLVGNETPEPGTIVGLGWFCAKDVQADDRIEFTDDETDEWGMPKPVIHYVLTDRDHATFAQAKVAILRAARSLGEFIGDAPIVLSPGASLHYQGSTRMGEVDDGTSVCSPSCEVWGVDGLYLGGNNVIPTAIACNPTLTSVALAVRGARDIATRLDAEVPAAAVSLT